MEFFKNRKKLTQLKWFDILIITIIIWGTGIYYSTILWKGYGFPLFSTFTDSAEGDMANTALSQLDLLFSQIKLLVCVLFYLYVRNFDFKSLKIKFDGTVIKWICIIFIVSGLASDVVNYITYPFYYGLSIFTSMSFDFGGLRDGIMELNRGVLLFSFFNGFYEEFYFLGLLLSIDKKYYKYMYIFSTLVRISFHTYQGLVPALAIGLFYGSVYYYLYTKKNNNLLPFFIAHGLADILGATFIGLLFSFA